jgi:hypothetical protein
MGLILPPEERSEHEAELLAVLAPPAAVVVARLSHEQYARVHIRLARI